MLKIGVIGAGFIGSVHAKNIARHPETQLVAVSDVNLEAAKKLAVDLPSGLDCDTGRPSEHTFRADHTCTFVAAKPGFFVEDARPYVGQIHVLDIGAPRKLLEEILSATS